MNLDEYAAAQAEISAAIGRFVMQFSKMFTRPALSTADWLGMLKFLYPQVENQRFESAKVARSFYDAERASALPDLTRQDAFLEQYSFERFVQDMEPARKLMTQEDSGDNGIGLTMMSAVRAVENAGRQQIIHAVEDDRPLQQMQQDATPEERVVRGWARVATGRETCAWCLMLVSRGPTYLGSDNAGLDLSDTAALNEWDKAGGDLKSFFEATGDLMQQWHPNCDCKVVPVFKAQSWPGSAEADSALELWKAATKQAIEEEEDDPDAAHTAGKDKGKTFTRNQRALNALRRAMADGQISPQDYAVLAA